MLRTNPATVLLRLTYEGSVLAAVNVFCNGDQEPFVELEHGGEHLCELPNAVQELNEGRRHFLRVALNVSAPVVELVPERQPVLLDERLEAVDGAVVAVQHQAGQGARLRGPVPTVGTVNNHRLTVD